MRLRVTAVVAVAAVAAVIMLGGAASAATGPTDTRNARWSGYTTEITLNAKGQPTSREYAAESSFRVPTLDCSALHHPIIGAGSSAGVWVGLGGLKDDASPESGHLVQAGILARCGKYRAFYDAVHQILPPDSGAIALDAKHPVQAGDSMNVVIERRSTHVYSMAVENITRRWTWDKIYTVSFANVPAQADYIVERPSVFQADFGTVTFHLSAYSPIPPGTCQTCGPSFLNEGYADRFVGVNPYNRDLAKVDPISSPVSDQPGTFSVTWARGF